MAMHVSGSVEFGCPDGLPSKRGNAWLVAFALRRAAWPSDERLDRGARLFGRKPMVVSRSGRIATWMNCQRRFGAGSALCRLVGAALPLPSLASRVKINRNVKDVDIPLSPEITRSKSKEWKYSLTGRHSPPQEDGTANVHFTVSVTAWRAPFSPPPGNELQSASWTAN